MPITPHDQLPAAPIACTLSPAGYADRIAQLRRIAAGALLARDPIPGGERLTFRRAPDVEAQLREAAAAEAACCSFLDLRLRDDGTCLELDVTGPAAARPVIAELFA